MTEPTRHAWIFRPHLADRVWGGRDLERFGRDLPPGRTIGETWEISAIPGGSSVVRGGPDDGRTLIDLLERSADAIIGDVPVPSGARFPLLVKLLDARQPLSIQLHPRDAEAITIEGDREGSVGKTEAWVILDAEPNAEIIHGLAPGVDTPALYERLRSLGGAAIPDDEVRDWFRFVPVRAGDVVFVPAGTIHALGAGIVLAEVQQSSDLTYRLYDWGRPGADGQPRELHLDKSERVQNEAEVRCPWSRVGDLAESSGGRVDELVACPYFTIETISLDSGAAFPASTRGDDRAGFHLLFAWDEGVTYEGEAGDRLEIPRSGFALVPAAAGEYRLRASAPTRCLRAR